MPKFSKIGNVSSVGSVYEQEQSASVDRFPAVQKAYEEAAKGFVEAFADHIHPGLTVEVLMRATFSNSEELLDGEKIWKNVFRTANHFICNTMLPLWGSILPKDGMPSSGKQSYDPYLTQFRMALFRQNNLIDLTYESPTSPDTVVNGTFVASLVNETIIVKEERMENEPEKRDEKENEEADSEEKDEKEFMTPKAKKGKKKLTKKEKKAKKDKAEQIDKEKRQKNFVDWFPVEWASFLYFGPISEQPFPQFFQLSKRCFKDSSVAEKDDENSQPLSRQQQRGKKSKIEKIEDSLPNAFSPQETAVLEKAVKLQEIQLKLDIFKTLLSSAGDNESDILEFRSKLKKLSEEL